MNLTDQIEDIKTVVRFVRVAKRGMNREAIMKEILNAMAKNGLDKWFAQKWVDYRK